jgi:hypothetical protein
MVLVGTLESQCIYRCIALSDGKPLTYIHTYIHVGMHIQQYLCTSLPLYTYCYYFKSSKLARPTQAFLDGATQHI